MTRRTWAMISILAATLAIGGTVGALGNSAGGEPEQLVPAPDFTLSSLEGERYTLSKLRGNVVILNFWATWCAPYRKEIPDLSRIFTAHKDDGLVVLGVSWDDLGKDKIRRFADNYKVTYPVLHGTQSELIEVGQAYGWEGYLPTSYIIDRDGFIREVHVGARSEQFFMKILDSLL